VSVEDRLDIKDLNYRYAIYVDSYQVDAWTDLFTEDAYFDESQFEMGLHEGHDRIRAYAVLLGETTTYMSHLMGNHLVENITADSATGTAFSLIEVQTKDGARTRYQVVYKDEYKKVDGAWKFARRVLHKTFEPETFIPAG